MQRIYRLFGSSIAISALSACAANTARDGNSNENVAVTRQADTTSYTQRVDEAAQAIVFEPSSSIDWVIAHVTIDGTRTTNIGMPSTGNSYVLGSLPLLPGDSLQYSFTFAVNGLAQDTQTYSYTVSTSFSPTAFYTQVATTNAGSAIIVVSAAPLDWADVHYTINGGAQNNVRLAQQGSDYVQPITLQDGDVVEYSVTYSTGVAVFDTAVAKYIAAPAGCRLVVDLGADSTTGNCALNGDSGGHCNLRAAFAAAQTAQCPATIELAVDSTVNGGQISVSAQSAIVVETPADSTAHTIEGNGTSRLLTTAPGTNLTLRNLSIGNFRAVATAGAILNNGTLDLEGVTLTGNTSTCFDVGAMTADTNCMGGAITNSGALTLGGGTVFRDNTVSANASTASFTDAWAAGGAIANAGTLSIVDHVFFTGNSAVASATSGQHPAPIGGATATAFGGAIYNSGTLTFTDVTLGRDFAPPYIFLQNSASASGSTVYGTTTFKSAGGAIENTGTMHISPAACVFGGNSAQTGANVDG